MLVGVGVMLLTALVGIFAIAVADGSFSGYPYLFVLPWTLALAVVMVIPSAVLYYQGNFTFANPLVLATWSYFFPAFVVGGILFSLGYSEPYFLALIQDAETNLPMAVVLVGLGFIGLSLGYFLPFAGRAGNSVAAWLPRRAHEPSSLAAPGVMLLVLGVFNTFAAFAVGLFGYQRNDDFGPYDGLIYLSSFFYIQGSFILWLVIFRLKKLTVLYIPVIALLVGTALSKALFAGNRGTVLQIFLVITLAYVLSGRQFKFRQGAVATGLLSVGLVLGMIYGTNFRMVKGSEAQQSAGQYVEQVFQTLEQVGRTDSLESLAFGFSSLAERVDILTTFAVVVANYEQLKPYEEAYGLDNNIWIDSTTFFIPRIFWRDKPSASDPRKYSDLYFNYGENSFAITAVGDLLRNFGVPGVFFGMLILGAILRFLFVALVQSGEFSFWRLTLYFMLMVSLSYEGFYGTIIPNFFKYGVIAIVGILLVEVFARKLDSGGAANQSPIQ